MKPVHDSSINDIIDARTTSIAQDWPCDFVKFEKVQFDLNLMYGHIALDQQLTIWNNNRLNLLMSFKVVWNHCRNVVLDWFYRNINHLENVNRWIGRSTKSIPLKKSIRIWKNLMKLSTMLKLCGKCGRMVQKWSSKDWWTVIETIFNTDTTDAFDSSRHFSYFYPSSLIRKQMKFQKLWLAPGPCQLHENNAKNARNRKWAACQIFEIEQNLTIGRIQIEIDKRMI